MSGCCGGDSKEDKLETVEQSSQGKETKNSVGKYLYKLGKKKAEKQNEKVYSTIN